MQLDPQKLTDNHDVSNARLREPLPDSGHSDLAIKFRIRFRKSAELRLVSHHDLMHVFERLFRRAEIPFRTTEGFHPKPKMAFALSLALGIVGCREVLELELTRSITAQDLENLLVAHAVPGLTIVQVTPLDRKSKARVCRAQYCLEVPDGRREDLSEKINLFLQQQDCWIERHRPKPRRINIRPYVDELTLDNDRLTMSLWVTPYGTARPDEVLNSLGVADILDEGGVLERTNLELEDESHLSGSRNLDAVKPSAAAPVAAERNRRSEPLFPGPMSFDT